MTTLILTSVSAYAVECIKPKECTLWAHQMCTESQKFLGDDECLECGCSTGYTEMPDKSCCKNDRVAEHGGVKECCLDSQSYLMALNGETFCCGGAMKAVTTSGDCCMEQVYIDKNKNETCEAPESCPDGYEDRTTANSSTSLVCCKNGYFFSFLFGGDMVSPYFCGCPDNGISYDDGSNLICCQNGKAYDENKGTYTLTNSICSSCPEGEQKLNDGSCCKNENIYNDPNTYEEKCCGTGHHLSEYVDVYNVSQRKKQCCPNGQDASSWGTCCPTNDLVDDWSLAPYKCAFKTPYDDINKACERPTPNQYGIKRCIRGAQRTTYSSTGAILACKNGVPFCGNEGGVTFESPGLSCHCGCYSNDDCIRITDVGIKRRCQSDNTCGIPKVLTFENITVVYDKFAGGEITQEKMEKIVAKMKEKLALSNEDAVTVNFTSVQGNAAMKGFGGFCWDGDRKNIHINTAYCEVVNETQLSCEGTIVHENIHRIDRMNEPLWGNLNVGLSSFYQGIITEVNAQAIGTTIDISNAIKACYKNRDGLVVGIYRDGPTASSPQEKQECKDFMRDVNSYGKGVDYYVNLGNAKRYFSDPEYFNPNNCNGLRGELERDFMNSTYARTGYYQENIEWIEETHQNVIAYNKIKDKLLVGYNLGKLGWNPFKSKDLNLSDLLVELYKKNAKMCMSANEFTNHPIMNIELLKSDLGEMADANDFTVSNRECMDCWTGKGSLASQVCADCQKKLECITDQFNEQCTPVEDFNKLIGKEFFFTF